MQFGLVLDRKSGQIGGHSQISHCTGIIQKPWKECWKLFSRFNAQQ
jgi:hypothetical protein